MVENGMILEGLSQWEQIQSSKSQEVTQSKQWSMVVIRDSLRRNDLSVFPPANHENLPISAQQNQKEQIPSSKSTHPSPCESDVSEVCPVPSDRGFTRWVAVALRALRATVISIPSLLGLARGAFWSFHRVAGMATVVLIWWLRMRARRQRWQHRESIDHLKTIIREKDEKIIQLLHQIAQMNELLVARHRDLSSKLTN
ncbi:hypothetical protein SLEP1_g43210 [Rubroshorea leprosula]|uniref:Transmembrane protein n=1 Tax=Rubroshorea leprosula TaxID=152421 RepID=A0AAV5LDA1_9ROSI|nr:hypothetical protein SLEP1_g43210 [Rubroshorea leprosula]